MTGSQAGSIASSGGGLSSIISSNSRHKDYEKASHLVHQEHEAARPALNTKEFDRLQMVLKSYGDVKKPRKPTGTQSGEHSGYLFRQGKFRGKWKKTWFLLSGPYLYTYDGPDSSAPKKARLVTFAMKDEVTADDLAADAAASAGSNAMVLTQLEERMCALRIIVYTPNGKAIVLSAPSAASLDVWVSKLEAAAKSHSEGQWEVKVEAAREMKPLMLAQMFAEVDTYMAIVANLARVGLIAEDKFDPRTDPQVLRRGVLKVMKTNVFADDSGSTRPMDAAWEKQLFVLAPKGDNRLYWFSSRKERKLQGDGASDDELADDLEDITLEEEEAHMANLPWSGCIDLTYCSIGPVRVAMGPPALARRVPPISHMARPKRPPPPPPGAARDLEEGARLPDHHPAPPLHPQGAARGRR